MDAFFASVEQLDNPQLRNRPVIVGGDPRKRGVVAACSYEARFFGVHSAMSSAKAAELCPGAIFAKPRMARYKEISAHVLSLFSEFTDLIEPLSIDEAFLDVTLNKLGEPSATRLAEGIRKRIFKETGLTASAGVSYNKFLAKIASDLEKPDGLSVIIPEKALRFLDALPISKFHGVGRVTEKKMLHLGIRTGRDLRQYTKEDLLRHFGKNGAFFHDMACGLDDRPVRPNRVRKSIGSETTLQHDSKDTHYLLTILHHLIEKVVNILLLKDCTASTITLKIRYHDFSTITRSITVSPPVFSAEDVFTHIHRLKNTTELGRKKIRLLGVTLSKLSSRQETKPVQLLLPFPKDERKNLEYIKSIHPIL
jgi:DNA polymerase-4